MNSDSGTFNLPAARSLAANSDSAWTEVINDEHNHIVVFRHDDDTSRVRRLVVDYSRSILYAVIRNDRCKNGTSLVYRPDSDAVILRRFFDNPQRYEHLGFRAREFKTSFSLPADAAEAKKGKKKVLESNPPGSVAPAPPSSSRSSEFPSLVLTDAMEGGAVASVAPESVPPSSSDYDTEEEGASVSAAPSSSLTHEDADEEGCNSTDTECSVSDAGSVPNAIFSEAVANNCTSPAPSGCPSQSGDGEAKPEKKGTNSSGCPSTSGHGEAKSGKKLPKAGNTRSKAAKPLAEAVPPPRGANIMNASDRKKLKKALPDFEVCGESSSVGAESGNEKKDAKFCGNVEITFTSPVSSGCAPKSGGGTNKTGTAGCKVKDFDHSAPVGPPTRGANILKPGNRKKLKKSLPDFEVSGGESGRNAGSASEKNKKDNGAASSWIRSLVDKKVEKELNAINLLELKCFALTPDGKGIVYAEKDGECFWSSEIGCNLANELNSSTKDRYPVAINMGSEGRYYVKYSNGEFAVNGNEKLVGIVKKGDVKIVAFGREYDSFAVVYENGRTDSNNVPKSLENCLNNCDEETKAEFVGMGVEGEYFVRQSKETSIDGKGSFVETMLRYGNIHSNEMFNALGECPRDIRKMAFGSDGSFVTTD